MTLSVPWGFVCGYPTRNGDLYGGAHYTHSSADTAQGRAILQASMDFGDGKTLPFTPCKKGFIPLVGETKMFACPLHNKARERRFHKENGKFRPAEVDLDSVFWSKKRESIQNDVQQCADNVCMRERKPKGLKVTNIN